MLVNDAGKEMTFNPDDEKALLAIVFKLLPSSKDNEVRALQLSKDPPMNLLTT